MSRETTGGGTLAGPATSEKISAATMQPDRRQSNRPAAPVVAPALAILAGPTAAFDRLLVRVCPLPGCGRPHVHHAPRGQWREPAIRAPRCAPHRRYRLEVVDVLPTASGQRRRGAA
jgi:hypothetical protein